MPLPAAQSVSLAQQRLNHASIPRVRGRLRNQTRVVGGGAAIVGGSPSGVQASSGLQSGQDSKTIVFGRRWNNWPCYGWGCYTGWPAYAWGYGWGYPGWGSPGWGYGAYPWGYGGYPYGFAAPRWPRPYGYGYYAAPGVVAV